MILRTKYNTRDVVYVVDTMWPESYAVLGPLTVGKITVEVIDSPGRDGEEMFDNYKAKKERKESYMMVETGIGTGRVFPEPSIFSTAEEAFAFSKFCQEEAKCRR